MLPKVSIRPYLFTGALIVLVLLTLLSVSFAVDASSELTFRKLEAFDSLAVDVTDEFVVGRIAESIKKNQKLIITVNGLEQRVTVGSNGEFSAKLKYRKGINLVHFRYGMKEKYYWRMAQCHSAGFLTIGIDRDTLALNSSVEIVFEGYPKLIAQKASVAVLKAYEVRPNGKIAVDRVIGSYPIAEGTEGLKVLTDIQRRSFTLPSDKLTYGVELKNAQGGLLHSFYLDVPLVQKVDLDQNSVRFYVPFFDPKEIYLKAPTESKMERIEHGAQPYCFNVPKGVNYGELVTSEVILLDEQEFRKAIITQNPYLIAFSANELIDYSIEQPTKSNTLLQTRIKGQVLWSVPEKRWLEMVINGKSYIFNIDNQGKFSGPVQLQQGYNDFVGYYSNIPHLALLYNGESYALEVQPKFSLDFRSVDACTKLVIPQTRQMRLKSPSHIKIQSYQVSSTNIGSNIQSKELYAYKLVQNGRNYESVGTIDLSALQALRTHYILAEIYTAEGEKLDSFQLYIHNHVGAYDESAKQYKIGFLQNEISSIALKTGTTNQDLKDYFSNGILTLDEKLFSSQNVDYNIEFIYQKPGIEIHSSLRFTLNQKTVNLK